MYKLHSKGDCGVLKMVKNKRDLKSPRRRSLTLGRPSKRARVQSAAGANIKVAVRVRPPSGSEQGYNNRLVIKIVDNQMLIFDPKEDIEPFFYHGVQQKGRDLNRRANKNIQFFFDHVFGYDAINEDVFNCTTQKLIGSLMEGYNCSVFAYGATGAGKTHTMLGNLENPGITVLTMAELFRQKQELSSERDFELGVTYLEVYNENVQDLLNPGLPLQLREDGKYGVFVAGIQMEKIEHSEELFEFLERGNRNRTQHPTDSNAESSRSHAVFQVYMRMSMKTTGQVKLAKLSMIDLAGSERGAATGCAGARFTEGANINKSLLALGNCINSLADGHRHVPYRDSKLTRLLKDSLGGNCHTVMIANISPSSLTYEDTYNTLKYATRAKKIKTVVKKNVMNCELHIGQYVKMLEELNQEIERLQTELKNRTCTCQNETAEESSKLKLISIFNERRQLQERMHQIEMGEQLLELRKRVKEDADQRLSGLCTDTPEKEKGHKRLGNAVDRITRQASALHTELESLEEQQKKLKKQIEELVDASPELAKVAELENAQLNELESKHKVEHLHKVNERLEHELNSRDSLFTKMAKMLRVCYLQVKGHGFATDTLNNEYQALVQDLQGIRNVKWSEDVDAPAISTTFSEEESRKRKLNDQGSNCSLDGTFVKSPIQPAAIAEQLTKVYKPPPAKRLAKLPPRKENKQPSNRPTAAMGTAQRFPPSRPLNNQARPPSRPPLRPPRD